MTDPWAKGPRALLTIAGLAAILTIAGYVISDPISVVLGCATTIVTLLGARVVVRHRVLQAERARILAESGDERADRYLG